MHDSIYLYSYICLNIYWGKILWMVNGQLKSLGGDNSG